MDVVHHLLSGFKALYTEDYLAGTEEARMRCGGAGYSAHSGLTALV